MLSQRRLERRPQALSLFDRSIITRAISDSFKKRVEMMVRDTHVYGKLLARQRHADVHGADPCFMAKMRPTAK